ncbi:CDGSH iron-sulfur domain-containing protein [Candidatus Clostridium stratigraminis]|uniref:CDGSH iron-sulfur domain-containing protein n=1 Tax=Candidatus Clostridium stratigraminis TaxID=3381661 RepID=A0ABW8T547_9CLOT
MNLYEKVEENLKKLCEECNFYGTSQCVPSKCNIGFAANAIKAAKNNEQQTISDGIKLIPQNDMKVYDENLIAKSIASVCKLCKECKGSHSENCIVALSRRSIERTHLREDVAYPGNILMYLVNVAKQDPDFSDKIRAEYTELNKEATREITVDKSVISQKSPIPVELKKGETYFWCTCGKSSNQPFCNGAHIGTFFQPLEFIAQKDGTEYLCACKHTKTPPYCDGSHKNL